MPTRMLLVLWVAASVAADPSAAPASPYSQRVRDNHPIAYWRLDETNGALVAHDAVGGHDCLYHNTQLGAAGYSSGDPDPAAGFGLLSASNSYAGEIDNSGSGIPRIDFSAPMGGNAAFSVEAWVNGAGLPQNSGAGIVTKGYLNGEQFNLDEGVPTYPLRFQVRNALDSAYNTYSSLNLYTNAGWHHVVGVCDEANSQVLLYVDGTLAASNSIPANSGILAGSAAPLMIGARATDADSGADRQFFGYIDEVAIYDYALSAGQVAEDYRVGTSSIPWFASVEKRGGDMVLGGYGGRTNGAYTLLTTTNLGLALTNWTVAATNTFDGSGGFSLTNPLTPDVSRQFYILQMPPALPSGNPDLWVPACGAWLGAAVTNGTSQNFSAHESKIGRQLDVLRIYHTPGSWTHLTTTELNYINAGRKLLLSVKPSSEWSNAVGVAYGGSASVDADMASLARSITNVKPAKIMLIVWHEPENDVTGGGGPGNKGTPTQYVEMWHNVRNIFDANGATNVIWCWCIQNIPTYRSLINSLWPGNHYVDWVMWDAYQSKNDSITNVVQGGYNWLIDNTDSTHDYAGKIWGIAEWGVGINTYYPTVAAQTNGINQFNAALNLNDEFPRLKLVSYFDEKAPALLPGSVPAYSNFVHSPYLEQECSP